MERAVIIVPTHSSYIDIGKVFLKMITLYWPDMKFRVIFSVTGENVKISDYETLYNGRSASLTDCVYKAALCYPAEYYFCFLGDALICKKVCNEDVDQLLRGLKKAGAQYCCLIPRKSRWNNREKCGSFRHIFNDDIYCHSFVAFIASRDYIASEMYNTTDFEFERKYLKRIYEKKFRYENDYILTSDFFHITQGIQKGKWNRKALKIVRKNIHGFSTERNVLGMGMTVYNALTLKIQVVLPVGLRRKIKSLFRHRFSVDY